MIADELVAAFTPWLTPDLETYLRSIGAMFTQVEQVTGADGEWLLFDPDLAPAFALPYLAQFVGEKLPIGLTEAAQREWIKDAPNQRRGTVQAIVRAAQRTLTGDRHVAIVERANGDSDALQVTTYTSETPSHAQVLADLLTVVPADLVLDYQTLTGQRWSALSGTWANVQTTYPSWASVYNTTAGATTWTRPR